jgi:hypothetical protein
MNSSPTPVPDTAQFVSAHVPAQQHMVAKHRTLRLCCIGLKDRLVLALVEAGSTDAVEI